jgi:signal transduction histidine kinase
MLVPHAVCWAAAPNLIWTMVIADSVTFLSYVSLCVTLLFIARRTFRVMVRDWMWFVVGFALFIVACGSTHLMEVVTTWIPMFWVAAWATIITAILSAYVAFMLMRRAGLISYGINDYARRLDLTQREKDNFRDKLLAARKLEDWSRMSTVISHEIANPLEAIQNALYLIRSDPASSPETTSLAEMASGEVSRVTTIARSAHSFFRESPNPESVDLRAAADSVVFLLRVLIQERQIQFLISGDEISPIEAYPGETRQVILNLARNACEAVTGPGQQVTLEFSNLNDGVQLKVTDQGCGVDPRIVPTLFEFGNTTKGQSGSGMGLWTVKQIMLKQGGEIALDTSYREGARFILWWPRTLAKRAQLESAFGNSLPDAVSLPA